MGNNKHDGGSVDDFRRTLTDLIRLNDQRGSKHPGSNPASGPRASGPRHPQHRPIDANPHANENRPAMPGHGAGGLHPAAPPPQHRHPASPPPMPTRSRVSRRELFERRMSSTMAQHRQHSSADSGMKAQAGLFFAGGLLVACFAVFALVYHLVADDRVIEASSHFRTPTQAQTQATLAISSADVSSNTPGSDQTVAASPAANPGTIERQRDEARANVTTANAKVLSDIANGSWRILPSDVNRQVRSEGAASVQRHSASLEPPGPNVMTRQKLFGSFQSYLEETGLARVANNPDQEALFNSFVRWSVEVAEAPEPGTLRESR